MLSWPPYLISYETYRSFADCLVHVGLGEDAFSVRLSYKFPLFSCFYPSIFPPYFFGHYLGKQNKLRKTSLDSHIMVYPRSLFNGIPQITSLPTYTYLDARIPKNSYTTSISYTTKYTTLLHMWAFLVDIRVHLVANKIMGPVSLNSHCFVQRDIPTFNKSREWPL